MKSPVLVFDIETIPDVEGLRNLGFGGPDADDQEVIGAYQMEKGREGDFLPLHLQKIIAISCVLRKWKMTDEGLLHHFNVWSLGAKDETEEMLIQRFYDGIQKLKPQLVSWNGGGFDLPVLHYRSLFYRIDASQYWEMGKSDRDFKYDHYIGRYHMRHIDLMDLLAMYQPRAFAPMDEMAKLCGFPGKLGMDGSEVYGAYQAGKIDEIRQYCETDVVNTYLLYTNFEFLRGNLDKKAYEAEMDLVANTLSQLPGEHWLEYLDQWKRQDIS